MQDALIRKLESFEDLTDADRAALRAFAPRVRQVGARTDLIQEGDVPGNVHLILDGFACRYKVLPDGQRQIMALLVPGDFCDLNVFILDEMDHTIGTITACRIVSLAEARFASWARNRGVFACAATAVSDEVTLDTTELEDAIWVDRAGVRAALADEPDAPFLAPPHFAIAHTLLRHWADS